MKYKSRFGIGFVMGFLASFVLFAFITVGIFIGHKNKLQIVDSISDKAYDKANLIREKIDENYLGDVKESNLEEGMYKGLVYGLGDKYSEYYSAEEFKAFMNDTSGEYKGIGVIVACTKDNRIKVIKVYKDTPAMRAGIKEGDCINAIKGQSVTGKDIDKAVGMLKNGEATEVELYRESTNETVGVVVKPESINIPNVEYKMVDENNKIGYVNIMQFSENAYDQFNDAIRDLQKQQVKAIIFDVRDNPGGSLSVVGKILDDLLPQGVIMTSKDRNDKEIERVESNAKELNLPMVVLQNENSASASELFAGAIQDYKKGDIIGTVSYGKGVLQKVMDLGDGSALKITTEKYYTPKGRNIHEKGIIPDVTVKNEKDSLALSLNDKQFMEARKNLLTKLGVQVQKYAPTTIEETTEAKKEAKKSVKKADKKVVKKKAKDKKKKSKAKK